MPIPQAPKRGPDNPRPIHFTYVNTPMGYTWTAYLTARPQWLHTHQCLQSKPCLREYTNGELTCTFCEKGKIAEVKALVGLYRQADGKPVLVWVNEDQRDVLDAMALHTRVHVAREKTKGSPISLLPCLDPKPRYETSLPERRVWADPTESILKLFKMPEFVLWYRHTHGLHDKPIPTVAPPAYAATNRVPFPMEELADVLDDASARAFARAAQEQEIAKRLREQKPNGKPKREEW